MQAQFPHKGYHKGSATTRQPEGTSPHIKNVRSFDPLDDRGRGGQRPGVDKWWGTQVTNSIDNPVVEMVQVSVVQQ